MNVVSVCPLRVASLLWQARHGVWVLTAIAKATYHLAPVESVLGEEQEYPNEDENHWNDDPGRSLYSPSDLAPFKPGPEVTLVGHAFAPRGEPVARLVARLVVGNVDKSIVAVADRTFSQDGALREGPRFNRMPLRYERAAGGPETVNPVGIRQSAPNPLGILQLPSLERPGLNVTGPGDPIEPIGFGPIAAEWRARRDLLGRHGAGWKPASLRSEPLPEGVSPRYFMSAPPDQALDELRADERLILENLHPEYPRLVTNLPGIEPRAFVERPVGAVAEVAMTCDTLWIDTDRSIATLTWRAQIPVDGPDPAGRVVVAMEKLGRRLAWSDVEAQRVRASAHEIEPPPASEFERTHPPFDEPTGDHLPALPFSAQRGDPGPGAPPFVPGKSGKAGRASNPRISAARSETLEVEIPLDVIEDAVARAEADKAMVSTQLGTGESARVAVDASPAWLRAPPAPPAGSVPTRPTLAAAAVPPPVPPPRPPAAGPSAPRPATLGSAPPAFGGSAPFPRAAGSGRPPEPPPAPPPPPPPPPPPALPRPLPPPLPVDNARAARRSDAPVRVPAPTFGPAPSAPAVEAMGREHVDLIWFDPAALPRIRASEALEDPETRDAPPVEALRILSRAAPLDEEALNDAARAAFQGDGTFAAPLVMVSGELAFDFDEVEALRATVAIAAPFVGTDRKLSEVVAAAAEVLESAWPVPADMAEGFTLRIEEAFSQAPRAVAPGYLTAGVERLVLEGRRYQKKTLLGEPRIRALFAIPGGRAPIPAYLPATLSARLPLYRRFRAAAIVELRPREDQYETHPDALLVLALGRLLRNVR
jgi:hypothetical protein